MSFLCSLRRFSVPRPNSPKYDDSPLSAVMACLFMEVLDTDNYIGIMERSTACLRYVDDVIVAMPYKTNVENKLRRLNNVNANIQFTVETEGNGKLTFLDTFIHRVNKGVRFSVYR